MLQRKVASNHLSGNYCTGPHQSSITHFLECPLAYSINFGFLPLFRIIHDDRALYTHNGATRSSWIAANTILAITSRGIWGASSLSDSSSVAVAVLWTIITKVKMRCVRSIVVGVWVLLVQLLMLTSIKKSDSVGFYASPLLRDLEPQCRHKTEKCVQYYSAPFSIHNGTTTMGHRNFFSAVKI